MKKLFIILMLFSVLFASVVSAQGSGHIKLLAVSGEGENQTGSVADLYLEIKPGTGRVFIDTFPLTKLDTQFSTRFAKSVACDYLDADCSKYDFFYRIESRSTIVGGPSAGTAITILTISLLTEKPIPSNLAVTGTINSGGIIGPVAGIIPKIEAAQRNGVKTVIIPKITIENKTEIDEFLNTTLIDVFQAATLDDVIFMITGEKRTQSSEIKIDPDFTIIMKDISEQLCNQTIELFVTDTNSSYEKKAVELYNKSLNATKNQTYYSAASFCFGANVEFRKLLLENKTTGELLILHTNLKNEIENFEVIVDAIELKTIADLQTYMIVKERLKAAKEFPIDDHSEQNRTPVSSDKLAYSIERYNSALSWANFFGSGKKEFVLDNEGLGVACVNRLSETKGYLDYVGLYINFSLDGIEKELGYATTDLNNGDYALCIFKASKAKAEISLILEALSITEDQRKDLLDHKIGLAKNTIINVEEKGAFPILGYSYFEYANTLKDSDPMSSLLYIGYSDELSNLDVYFEKKHEFSLDIDYGLLGLFSVGMLFGMIITFIILSSYIRRNYKKKR